MRAGNMRKFNKSTMKGATDKDNEIIMQHLEDGFDLFIEDDGTVWIWSGFEGNYIADGVEI